MSDRKSGSGNKYLDKVRETIQQGMKKVSTTREQQLETERQRFTVLTQRSLDPEWEDVPSHRGVAKSESSNM